MGYRQKLGFTESGSLFPTNIPSPAIIYVLIVLQITSTPKTYVDKVTVAIQIKGTCSALQLSLYGSGP